MTRTDNLFQMTGWSMTILLAVSAVGCSSSRDPILGSPVAAALPPTVSASSPANLATGIPANLTAITASFSQPVAPLTGSASFTVTCAPPGVNPTGTVSLDPTSQIATYTTSLAPGTLYTATITGAQSLITGLPLASPYAWTFATAATASTTLPRVALTVPATTLPGPTTGVPTNTAITALFSQAMAAATFTPASFTVTTAAPGQNPAGTVTYSVGAMTAVFTPSAPLAANTTYTATLSTAATNASGGPLAGNQAALPASSNYVWSFTTGSTPATSAPTLTLANPADQATDVALNASVGATFSAAMNPLTLTTATFTLQPSGPPVGPALTGAVAYDALTRVATLTPSSPLAASTTYTVTISNAATDLNGNPLTAGAVPNPWTFTTGTSTLPGAVALGSASTFGLMATAAITNTGLTVINGDVDLDPGTSMTGFPPGIVNGTVHLNDAVAAQARIDLLTAYNYAKNLAPGTTIPGGADLGALYPNGIAPGTYTSGSTMLVATPLTLDAGGNANAIWVFQIGSSLTTGASLTLTNGAQASNVFWVPTLDATVGVGTTFYGTIVSGRNVTAVTGATINGRILAGATLAGTIALQTTTVNVPSN